MEPASYELISLTKRLAALQQQHIDARLKPYGLARTQYVMLFHLNAKPDISTSELAERMLIEPATLSGIADALQAKGLVKRISHASDKRRKDIRLTIKGHGVFGNIPPIGPVIEQIMLDGISATDEAIVKAVGKRMVENLKKQLKKHEEASGATEA